MIKPKCMVQQILYLLIASQDLVNGDTEADLDTAVSISRAAGEAVGTYTITPSGAADSNYAISFVTADFSITAAPVNRNGK